jgi:hypothetical protein
MKRPDSDLIRRLIKHKALNDKSHLAYPTSSFDSFEEAMTLERILELPYFHMAYKNMDDFEFAADDYLLDKPDDAMRTELVYDEFVLSAKTEVQLELHDSSIQTAPANYWGVVKTLQNGTNFSDSILMFIEYPEAPRQIVIWEGWAESNDGEMDLVMVPEYEKYMRTWYQSLVDSAYAVEGGFNKYMSGITTQAGTWYWFIRRLMAYIKYGDKHVVEVTPTADKLAKAKRNPANRKRPWAKSSGPNVLLLDRMPTEKAESTGTHASPKPHKRRGYWKTLRDPIYRHHPQYQKKIFVKPCFVGDKQVTYEGNIYRLVEPLEGEA